MNIFYLDNDTTLCAQYHNDKHVVKMILETAQLLSTAHRVLDGNEFADLMGMYKATHVNHPCAKWVRESALNYMWLKTLFDSLCEEYTHRYEKMHKCEDNLRGSLCYLPTNIPKTVKSTEPPKCMPDYCKAESVVLSYRNYYKLEKASMAKWKNREVPAWWRNS